MKKILLFTTLIILFGCKKEEVKQGECPTDPSLVMELTSEKSNALADSKDEVIIKAIFCKDFNTEDDNKIEFILDGQEDTSILVDLKLVYVDGVQQKVAIAKFKSSYEEMAMVRANVSINGVTYSKEIEVAFGESLPQKIDLSSSSISLEADSSFSEITLTSKVSRINGGSVSQGLTCETVVQDTLGQNKGVFINYMNSLSSDGIVVNQYTLGLQSYIGKLFVISTTEGPDQTFISDTVILYVQP